MGPWLTRLGVPRRRSPNISVLARSVQRCLCGVRPLSPKVSVLWYLARQRRCLRKLRAHHSSPAGTEYPPPFQPPALPSPPTHWLIWQVWIAPAAIIANILHQTTRESRRVSVDCRSPLAPFAPLACSRHRLHQHRTHASAQVALEMSLVQRRDRFAGNGAHHPDLRHRRPSLTAALPPRSTRRPV